MSTSYLQAFLPKSLHPFVTLSYPLPSAPSSLPLPLRHLLSSSHPAAPTGKAYTRLAAVAGTAEKLYGKGPKDLYFAVFCAIAFTVLREIMLRYILSAFARAWLMSSYRKSKGASKSETGRDRRMKRRDRKKMEHTVTRFAEQGWSFIYCTVFWSMGMVSGWALAGVSEANMWLAHPVSTAFTAVPTIAVGILPADITAWLDEVLLSRSTWLVVPPDLRDQQ
jgi:acyl-CoA-dependent ceramide synthase